MLPYSHHRLLTMDIYTNLYIAFVSSLLKELEKLSHEKIVTFLNSNVLSLALWAEQNHLQLNSSKKTVIAFDSPHAMTAFEPCHGNQM